MDFKTGKIIEIVREFLANNGDRFEINGVDLSRAVFLYRMKNTSFEPIPKGNYSTKEESNILYLKVDDVIKAKAYEYQIIYVSEMKAGKYLETYPELKVLVSKYNDLVEDVTNIIKYAKTTGIKVDTLKMTQILTPLEPNTFWAMNKDGVIETYPLGDLNSKYEQMVSALKKEVEELIKTTKEKALSDVNNSATSKLNNFQSELSKKLKELETLSDSLKSNLSSAVAKYIVDNREQLKGDRGAGITSITAVQDKVTVNYDDNKSTVFTVPKIIGKEIKNITYTDDKLKIEMNDNSIKQVEIKTSMKIKKIFDGELTKKVEIELDKNWKLCCFEYLLNSKIEVASILRSGEDISISLGYINSGIDVFIKNNKFSIDYQFENYTVKKIFIMY
jgi:hypothetical protein